MGAITGAFSTGAVQVAGTWGTAVASGAGDRFAGEATITPAVDLLTERSIGSGRYMASNFTRGNILYSASVTADLGYRNGCDSLLAVLMGTSGSPSEQTAGQGDYLHTLTFNTAPTKFVTFAYESTSALVHELPTSVVTSVGISSTSIPGYIDFTAGLLANTLELSTAVNTNATLQATTFTEGTAELTTVDQIDTFRTNAQSGGAVSGSDQYSITGFDLNLARPYEIVNEIKGSAGASTPVASDKFGGTLSLQVKDLADHAMYTIWTTESARKARLSIEGTAIGTGVNKRFTIILPRLIMTDPPNFALTNEGRNPLSLSFNLGQASSNPTGMSSTFPYFEIVNTLSTTLLP